MRAKCCPVSGRCRYRGTQTDTPGISSNRVTRVCSSGDIVHFPHIQIERPDVSIAFDQEPSLAASTRSRLLDVVSSEGLLIAGMHLGEPGFARIQRSGRLYGLHYETAA